MQLLESSDPILNPTIVYGGFEFREPITALTNLIVAFVAIYAVYRFRNYKGERTTQYHLYLWYFVCLAAGMIAAALLGHTLQAYLSPKWKAVGWILSTAGQLFLILASISQLSYRLSSKMIKGLEALFILKFVVFVILVLAPATSDFRIVAINSTIDFVFTVLTLQWLFYRDHRIKGTLFVVAAQIYAAFAGIVYANKISLNHWFNYHDLSHVLMIVFISVMFWGTFSMVTDPGYLKLGKLKN